MADPMTPDSSNPFTSVPVEITISVGKARPAISDLLKLGENSVLQLDRRVDDPVELFIGDKLIARGQLEEIEGSADGQLAVRLTELADLQNGLG
ncbi:FliM/FliN family flagellar motor switch protein [Shimia haliotis]|uniref:Flagellar motor switch protein FliN n=1 Tax=Shimia haliotis TaxID=1280847 RepID=A0A1I4DCB5_9RHOB|nr:FliM/FliN family flagellar motor C-terminal domain-containing protein [Shimia haliotis]SFK91278.1 flagellar motor switch protein FliN/FliY [Shimia haliotis]